MNIITVTREKIFANKKTIETKTYKILGIPVSKYTYIQRDSKQASVNYGLATGKPAQ